MTPRRLRLTLVGVGAMRSPRFAPAGLLVEHSGHRVMIDGGPGAAAPPPLAAWLVTDERCELRREIRSLARDRGCEPAVGSVRVGGVTIKPRTVVHTSHPTFGYLISGDGRCAGWAPEFWVFPAWAGGCDLLFAEGASWNRPIRFAGGAGGHAPVVEVAAAARAHGVARLVFAHLGRPTIAALDAGAEPPFGEVGREGDTFVASGPDRRWRRRRIR